VRSSKHLVSLVRSTRFTLDKSTFCALHRIVARNDALDSRVFRGESADSDWTPYVALGDAGRYTPLPTEAGALELNRIFATGVRALSEQICNPLERGCAFFLFGALHKFFFDGNSSTSRFMMNAVLMSSGVDAISVPAQRAGDFNEKMVGYYTSKDATEMMAFLAECHPET
jgi:Fic family protein